MENGVQGRQRCARPVVEHHHHLALATRCVAAHSSLGKRHHDPCFALWGPSWLITHPSLQQRQQGRLQEYGLVSPWLGKQQEQAGSAQERHQQPSLLHQRCVDRVAVRWSGHQGVALRGQGVQRFEVLRLSPITGRTAAPVRWCGFAGRCRKWIDASRRTVAIGPPDRPGPSGSEPPATARDCGFRSRAARRPRDRDGAPVHPSMWRKRSLRCVRADPAASGWSRENATDPAG